MNWKRFVIAVIVVFVAMGVMDFIVDILILRGAYEPLIGTVFRSQEDMNSKMWAIYVGELIFALMFVWIYHHGVKGKGIMEGFRYGLYIGLLLMPVSALVMWTLIPISCWLAWMWTIFGIVEIIILGLIAGAIYRPIKA